METVERPYLSVIARVPEISKFSSKDEPMFELKITLVQAQSAIAIDKNSVPWRPLVKATTIKKTGSGTLEDLRPWESGFINSKTPTMFTASSDDFLILSPGQAVFLKNSFRPFGPTSFSIENIQAMTGFKYGALTHFGMHALEVGEEYELSVKKGLRIKNWMFIPSSEQHKNTEWRGQAVPLEINAEQPTKFVVER